MKHRSTIAAVSLLAVTAGCADTAVYPEKGVKPLVSFPVTTNSTPYSQCLTSLASIPGNNVPVFAVGEVADKTGQVDLTNRTTVLSQGVSEMVMSAIYKTGKAKLVERFDLRIPLAETKMVQQKMSQRSGPAPTSPVRASDFVVLGALTELNYNIVSEGLGLWVGGAGVGGRTVIINVGVELRVVNSQTFDVVYVSSLQKQILGYQVEANVFRFFGSQLVEFDAGRIQNEPLQLGVRSVVEMAVYQIMTDYLGLPGKENCSLEKTDFMDEYLNTRKES
jgi:curli production assembly/transport component CsgG/holdfast attachment protein HfaB